MPLLGRSRLLQVERLVRVGLEDVELFPLERDEAVPLSGRMQLQRAEEQESGEQARPQSPHPISRSPEGGSAQRPHLGNRTKISLAPGLQSSLGVGPVRGSNTNEEELLMSEDRYTTREKTTTAELEKEARRDANQDPITGEPGSHPVGTGVGATSGAVGGAAIGGAVGGPVGAMIGAAVGGLTGALAGKGVAEAVNPTEEDAYWRSNYASRPYAGTRSYDDLQPAYQYGWESRTRHRDRNWSDVEGDLERDWSTYQGGSNLSWNEARHASRDAWDRIDNLYQATGQSYGVLGSPAGLGTGIAAAPFDVDYWRQSYSSGPYSPSGHSYEDYEPAYRYGVESSGRYQGSRWEEAEGDLERGWETAKGKSRLAWHDAKNAVKDAWHRVERAVPGDADRDGR